MKRIGIIMLIITIASLAYAVDSFAARRALLISVGKHMYNDEFVTADKPVGLTGLSRPNNLAHITTLMKNYWGFKDEEIKILKDYDATRANILNSMETWLVDGTSPGDVVFIYYNGHGTRLPDTNGDEVDGYDEGICPTDIRKSSSDAIITDDEIGQVIEKLKGRTVVTFFDCCHSGSGIKGLTFDVEEGTEADVYPNYIPYSIFDPTDTREAFEVPKGDLSLDNDVVSYTLLLSACQPDEVSWSVNLPYEGWHCVATYCIYRGITEGKADTDSNGKITFRELQSYVSRRGTQILTNFGCSFQHPDLYGSDALMDKDIAAIFNPKPEEEIPAPPPPEDEKKKSFNLSLWVTDEGKETFRVGEQLIFKVKSEKDGYLYLFDVQNGKDVVMLYPNKYSGDNKISGNKTISVPDIGTFIIEAIEPGSDVVVAVVTTKPYSDVQSLISENFGDYKVLTDLEKKAVMGMIWDLESRPLSVKPSGEDPGEHAIERLKIQVIK